MEHSVSLDINALDGQMKWNGMNDPVDAIHYVADGFSFFIATHPLSVNDSELIIRWDQYLVEGS